MQTVNSNHDIKEPKTTYQAGNVTGSKCVTFLTFCHISSHSTYERKNALPSEYDTPVTSIPHMSSVLPFLYRYDYAELQGTEGEHASRQRH